MSKKETPLTRKYWEEVGGTLIEEFVMVPKGKNNGIRLIDAIIIPSGENKILKKKKNKFRRKRYNSCANKSK